MLEATLGILTAAGIVFSIGLWASHTSNSATGRDKSSIQCKTSGTEFQAGTTASPANAEVLPVQKKAAANVTTVLTAEGGGIGPLSHAGTNGL
jgi:hypothetical protein